MKRTVRWTALPLAAATAVLGMTIGLGQTSFAAPAKAYKVGIVTEKTGLYSSYISEWMNGVTIGLNYATKGTNEVNGHKIKLTIEDDSDNPTTAVTDFKSLVGAGYKIIGGTGDSGIADVLTPLAAQNKVIYISGAAAGDELTGANRYTFRSGRQTYQDVQTAASYVKALGTGKKIVVLGQDYSFGQSYVTDATKAFASLGDTVTPVLVPLTTTDFTATALQVQQDSPDILFLAWAGGTIVPLIQDLGANGTLTSSHVVTGLANIATYPFFGAVGQSFNYISLYTYQSPHNPVNNYLIAQMAKKYKSVPDLFTADGFVWAQMVVRALQTGQGSNVNNMIKGLANWTFNAPKGVQTIRTSDHAMLQPMFQVQLAKTVAGVFQPVTLGTLSAKVTAPPVSAHFSK
jgi:branched-chain amino acid transport system substrate-binding protein